jgi:hypothetical protein
LDVRFENVQTTMSGLTEASALLEGFSAGSLRTAVARLENSFAGLNKLGMAFLERHGDAMRTVSDYYLPRKHLVAIRDLGEIIPALRQ